MHIAIFGAGSMGSVFGGKLARSGADIILFDKDERIASAVKARGLRVRDHAGEFSIPVAATSRIGDLSQIDLALVLVDGNATREVAPLIPRVLAPDGFALTLQNGIGNVEALVEELGQRKALGGSTFVSAALIEPGFAHNTNIGETVLGEIDGEITPRAEHVASMLRSAGFPTTVTGNAMGHVWSKFALNCALNPLCALTGLRPGEVVRHKPMSDLLDELIGEIVAVVDARGISLPEMDSAQHIRDHAFLRYNRPSMLQHIEAGRRTEIAGLNGALVAEAARLGIPVPVNRTIAALIQGIEARQRRGSTINEHEHEELAAAEVRGLANITNSVRGLT